MFGPLCERFPCPDSPTQLSARARCCALHCWGGKPPKPPFGFALFRPDTRPNQTRPGTASPPNLPAKGPYHVLRSAGWTWVLNPALSCPDLGWATCSSALQICGINGLSRLELDLCWYRGLTPVREGAHMPYYQRDPEGSIRCARRSVRQDWESGRMLLWFGQHVE